MAEADSSSSSVNSNKKKQQSTTVTLAIDPKRLQELSPQEIQERRKDVNQKP
jgi:hypothetical protein